ncbi:C9orf171 [Bugula neritina]|uniref:C9orf171 n=1 Tax=Bugula neritina TaxID=10212 RepID=A0A7J7JFB9_BUGNE|nr:C9orf171 [Bugula neritina]
MQGLSLESHCEGGRSLPPEGFTYGAKQMGSRNGVAEAFSNWGVNLPGLQQTQKLETERDFMALNKAALASGLVTAPENYSYRATHDIRRLTEDAKREKMRQDNRTKKRLPPSTVYGVATRPSTPIYELIEHKYQDRWIEERCAQQTRNRKQEEQVKAEFKRGNFAVNRTMVLRMHQDPVEPQPLWTMPKFSKNAKPHIESFRTRGNKGASFKNYESDRVPRRGPKYQHGIYEPAQS